MRRKTPVAIDKAKEQRKEHIIDIISTNGSGMLKSKLEDTAAVTRVLAASRPIKVS